MGYALEAASVFVRRGREWISAVALLAPAVRVVRGLWQRKRLEVVLEVVTLRHEVGDVLAVEEAHLDAHDGAEAEDEYHVDPAELEGGLCRLLRTVRLLF